jgi:hypothetical protein
MPSALKISFAVFLILEYFTWFGQVGHAFSFLQSIEGITVYVFSRVLITSSGVVSIDAMQPAAEAQAKICGIVC